MALSNDTPAPMKPLMAGCQQEPCSPSSTPETEAEWERKDLWRPIDLANAMKAKCERMERERDEATTALMEIEEVFVDGSDTYEDWKSMGTIAREFLSANAEPIHAENEA